MSYLYPGGGRQKALSTVRLVLTSAATTNNATLSLNSAAGSTVTYYPGTNTTLFASTSQTVNYLEIFDSFGFTARLLAGGNDLLLDFPGGNGGVPIFIAPGTLLAITPITNPVYVVGAAAQAELSINFYG